MKKSMFLTEWKNIFTNKKLLISLTAVLFVPLMYAGMFLWAFWDPYDYLDKLPIAVINEDQGADFEGEHLDIGDELVENLQDLDELNFDVVSRKKGYQDLENQEYYMLVEIPEDFSKNATTLLDDHPEKLKLKYIPNESYNFLSSQIGESAVKEIKTEIAGEVSKTYAETMFDKLGEIADGFEEASDGSGKIDDGAVKLKDGSKELKVNLEKLASKSIQFEDGVNTAAKGSSELAQGAQTLSSGVSELYLNSNKLRDASEDLQAGAGQLANGIAQADNGVTAMKQNVPKLVDGTQQVQNGLTQLHNQLPEEMAKKVNQTVKDKKGKVRQTIDDTIAQKEKEIAPKVKEQITNGIAQGASEGVVKEVNKFIPQAPKAISESVAKDIVNYLKEAQDAKTEQIKEDISSILSDVGVPDQTINEVINKIDGLTVDYNSIEEFVQVTLQSGLEEVLAGVEITQEQQQKIENIIREKAEPKVEQGVNQALDDANQKIDYRLDNYEKEIMSHLDDITKELETEIKAALDNPIGQLQGGLTQINDGQKTLQNGVNQLSDGTGQLRDGSGKLVSGQNSYVDNMYKFTSSFQKADTGASDLANGAGILNHGMYQLSDGAHQFNDGSHKLADGSGELSDGTKELRGGTKELHEKLDEAADEVGSVKSDDETYDMMGSPVTMGKEEINKVPNYGTGFAPYFISLGLFVGALVISIVLNLNDPIIEPRNALSLFLSKFGMLAVVGIIQALILDAILLLGLGLEVKSVPLFMFVSIVTSLVFMTLVQFLSTVLGDPGRFIAIVILILQLTTSAGTFPLELIPDVLHTFNSLLPMTYSVQAFKAVVSSGDYAFMWKNVGILATYIVVAMGLTYSYFLIKSKKTDHAHEQQMEEA